MQGKADFFILEFILAFTSEGRTQMLLVWWVWGGQCLLPTPHPPEIQQHLFSAPLQSDFTSIKRITSSRHKKGEHLLAG
jgi:hypothetical protein